MNKNLISLAVAASVATSAAVQAGQFVNPDKTGEVLLFPFYNADNGNASNMHIVNTTSKVKAVKIRFLEYKNSDEVLDFNLYLSPRDHFAFGVIKDPNGDGAAIITADNSCTVPALGSPNGAFPGTTTENDDGSVTRIQPFVNYQYANDKDVDSSIQRTLTGHVEVIEMGTVANAGDAKSGKAYAAYATHGATGVPASCAGLDKAWATGEWGNPTAGNLGALEGIGAPEGGLYGLAYHINVDAAAAFGYEPTSIDDWAVLPEHTNPGSLDPSITDGTPVATVQVAAGVWDDVTFSATADGTSVLATTALLQTASLSNDVMVNSAIGGMTDWVVTFPTKRAHVDRAVAIAPFTDTWDGSLVKGSAIVEKPACEPVSIGQWDREEAFTAAENGFSPQPDAVVSKICNETAVIAMGDPGTESALSVETGLTNLGFPYTEGWQKFTFDAAGQVMALGAVATATLNESGLPAIGFAAYKVNNGAMSYGNAAEHKTETMLSARVTTAD
jgi:hypothetical protein